MNGGDLLEQLRVLETELHRFETRQNRKRIELLQGADITAARRWKSSRAVLLRWSQFTRAIPKSWSSVAAARC